MKNYFAYRFDEKVADRLSGFYEDLNLNQHNVNHLLKSDLKLRRIKSVINFSSSDLVLDVGCSNGRLLKSIAGEIKEGVGADISKKIIVQNRESNKLNNLSFFSFDGVNVEKARQYDKIFLIDVVEHAFYPDRLLENVREILKPDGLLTIEVPFTGFLSEIIYGEYHQGHLRYYDPEYLTKYLAGLGFWVENLKVYNSVPFASFFIKLPVLFKVLDILVNLVPHKFYPYFGEIIVVVKNG